MSGIAPFPGQAAAPPARDPALDRLRGVAILMVLAYNLNLLEGAAGIGRGLETLFNLGWVGVQLFFVLSGFLITRILLRNQTSAHYWRFFLARRALRIWPLYLGSLLVLFGVLPLFGEWPPGLRADREHQLWFWLFATNWAPQFNLKLEAMPHYWSLALEEQFYLLWPLLVWRLRPMQVLALSVVLFGAAAVARALLLANGAAPEVVYQASLCRMDALAVGAGLAALSFNTPAWRWLGLRRQGLLVAMAVLLVLGVALSGGLFPRTSVRGQVWGYGVLALVFGLWTLHAALAPGHAERKPGPAQWVLSKFGQLSFGLYIIHKPLHDWVAMPWLAQQGWSNTTSPAVALAYLTLALPLLLALAWGLFNGVERPFLQLKRHFPNA